MNPISPDTTTSKYHYVKLITFNMVYSRVDMVIIGLICLINGLNIIDIISVINISIIYF